MRFLPLLVAAVVVSLGAAAQAQTITNPGAWLKEQAESRKQLADKVPAALQQKLDGALAAKDYLALFKAINETPPIERFVWLSARFDDGNSVVLVYPLLRELWELRKLKSSPLGAESEKAAGVMALYAFQVHLIDGAICEDLSAPGPRLTQFLATFREIFQSLKAKPFEEKRVLIRLALQMENKSRGRRKGDDYLCRGGIAELQASAQELGPNVTIGELAKKYGKKSKSGLGTDVKLPPPKRRYEPKFLPPEAYLPKQKELRMNMVGTLADLLK